MPYLGIGLHVVIALFFAVHAVRSHQNTYWLIILFSFPGLGSIVYLLAIYLPDIRHSRGAHVTARVATQLIDPNRAVRQARREVDRAPTVQNRMHLANALLASGESTEARQLYQDAAHGPFADDPDLLKGLARAEFACGNGAGAVAALDTLFAAHPIMRDQADPGLLYARSLALAGLPAARRAFEQALIRANSPAAACLYAEWLQAQGNREDQARAGDLFAEIINEARHWPRATKKFNKEWIQRAQAGLGQA
ncbi:tetratricopeptide repeat protein [Achromobacter sp. DH1f]|uniref:tetratricopeptide repeat protein n=1 Tax=Achromobacter sp. DH1f TaxID=1397275 RepID=UPI00046A0C0C|nr:tetratricopeptide repeat protein [Achromobacter sp. DH1f]